MGTLFYYLWDAHKEEVCAMSQTAVPLLQCFAFQMNYRYGCFLRRSRNPDLKQPNVCLGSHFHGRQFISLIGLTCCSLLSLSRDLPVSWRYEVSGLLLDPLVSAGGKLSLGSHFLVHRRLCCEVKFSKSCFSFCMLCTCAEDSISIKWTCNMLWSGGFFFHDQQESQNLMIVFHYLFWLIIFTQMGVFVFICSTASERFSLTSVVCNFVATNRKCTNMKHCLFI